MGKGCNSVMFSPNQTSTPRQVVLSLQHPQPLRLCSHPKVAGSAGKAESTRHQNPCIERKPNAAWFCPMLARLNVQSIWVFSWSFVPPHHFFSSPRQSLKNLHCTPPLQWWTGIGTKSVFSPHGGAVLSQSSQISAPPLTMQPAVHGFSRFLHNLLLQTVIIAMSHLQTVKELLKYIEIALCSNKQL